MDKHIVAIHQPQYLPWIPYFDKILRSDRFILLDNVQFQKNGMQNRNRIKTPSGAQWLTVPVKHHFGQKISETEIAEDKILDRHLKTLQQNYRKSPCFTDIDSLVSPVFQNEVRRLVDLNRELIMKMLDYLNYRGEVILASDLKATGTGSDLVLNLCKALDAGTYLSGPGGRDYMKLEDFEQNGIEVVFQAYRGIEYPQCHPDLGFVRDLSAIDLLYNVGSKAKDLIEQGRLS